jgi:hypothetical protein
VVVANSTAARSNGSLSADLDQLQIENKTASASITADKAKNKDEERQLMECDSSVPSPPSKPQPEDEEMLSRPGSSTQTREEENGQDKGMEFFCLQKKFQSNYSRSNLEEKAF